MLFKVLSYKHRAPPEHFTEATTLSGKAGWRVGGWTGLEGSGFKVVQGFKARCTKSRLTGSSLCSLCVLCASVVKKIPSKNNHRDTEDTEVAQRNSPHIRLFVQAGSRFKV